MRLPARKKQAEPFPSMGKSAPMDLPMRKQPISPQDIKEQVGFPPDFAEEQQIPFEEPMTPFEEPAVPTPTGEVPAGYEQYEAPAGGGIGAEPFPAVMPQENIEPLAMEPPVEAPPVPTELENKIAELADGIDELKSLGKHVEKVLERLDELEEKFEDISGKLEGLGDVSAIKSEVEKANLLLRKGLPAIIKEIREKRSTAGKTFTKL